MTPAAMVKVLERAEAALAEGRTLEGTGFWKAVGAARRDSALAIEFAVPAGVGTALLAGASGAGVAALVLAGDIESRLLRSAVFLAALGALEVGTHSLAHWAVGRAMGMRFTYYFLGGPPPPRPGAKLDYGSYLRVPPAQRAVMHASGAVVTKIVPFALIPVARSLDLPAWVVYLLLFVGLGQLATDAVLSTKSSDWKKVKRELKAAKGWVKP
jgi:hypothetical protein